MMTMRMAIALAFLVATLVLGGGVAPVKTFAQCPEVPPFTLIPPSYPCPVIPTCGTQYGVCRWPYAVSAGTPCQCQAANGAWIPGVITRGTPGR